MAVTWIEYGLIAFGVITLSPLCVAQSWALGNPRSRKTKDLLLGKGGEWCDEPHCKSGSALAWADWFIMFPLLVVGSAFTVFGNPLGYTLWSALGFLLIYVSIYFWVFEKNIVYERVGAIRYYTYFWGNFLYLGIGLVTYSAFKIA